MQRLQRVSVLGVLFVLTMVLVTTTAQAVEEESDTYYEYGYSITRNYTDPSEMDFYGGEDYSYDPIEFINPEGGVTIRAQGTSDPASGYIASVGAKSSWTLGPGDDTEVNYVNVHSNVIARQQFVYQGGDLSFDLAWDGGYEWNEQVFSFWNPVTVLMGSEGWQNYGYMLTAHLYSTPGEYWASASDNGGAWSISILEEEAFIDDLSSDLAVTETTTANIGAFLPSDIGKTFWLELTMETFLEGGGDYTVTGNNAFRNSVDFLNTFGTTSVTGADIVPEPTTICLLAAGGLAWLRRRKK